MKEFKPVLFFLLRIILVYGLLTVLYNFFLQQYIPKNIPDAYTEKTAEWVIDIMNLFGEHSFLKDKSNFPAVDIFYKNTLVSYVNEGCNGISIIIIFIAFMSGFYTKFIPTFLFILFGTISIILFNLLRISGINFILYYYPEYGKIAHDYLFPIVIYGYIVVLWIIWIQFFLKKHLSYEK